MVSHTNSRAHSCHDDYVHTALPFVNADGTLLPSQQTDTEAYSAQHNSSPHLPPCLHFNIISVAVTLSYHYSAWTVTEGLTQQGLSCPFVLTCNKERDILAARTQHKCTASSSAWHIWKCISCQPNIWKHCREYLSHTCRRIQAIWSFFSFFCVSCVQWDMNTVLMFRYGFTQTILYYEYTLLDGAHCWERILVWGTGLLQLLTYLTTLYQ